MAPEPAAPRKSRAKPAALAAAPRVEPPTTSPAQKSSSAHAASEGPFAVQVGAFGAKEAARALAESLRGRGYEVYVSRGEGEPASWRVRVGPLPTRERAERAARVARLRPDRRIGGVDADECRPDVLAR